MKKSQKRFPKSSHAEHGESHKQWLLNGLPMMETKDQKIKTLTATSCKSQKEQKEINSVARMTTPGQDWKLAVLVWIPSYDAETFWSSLHYTRDFQTLVIIWEWSQSENFEKCQPTLRWNLWNLEKKKFSFIFQKLSCHKKSAGLFVPHQTSKEEHSRWRRVCFRLERNFN